MQIRVERRQTTLPSAAILSSRATRDKLALKTAFRSAGIATRVLPLEEGALSEVRPPIVLDAVGLAPRPLIGHLLQLNAARLTTVVIVEETDVIAQRLSTVCQVVRALIAVPVGLEGLAPWLRHFADPVALPIATAPRWFGLNPLPALDLPPAFLTVLKALIGAPTMDTAVQRYPASRATFYRLLAACRVTVGLPPGRLAHHSPDALATALLYALNQNIVSVRRCVVSPKEQSELRCQGQEVCDTDL